MPTAILGAGIIGLSTAYYLSLSPSHTPSSIHLIDPSPELFASASGFAGGFLASDWFGPSTASLGALSFKLHQDLAEKYDGRNRWGYTESTAISLDSQGRAAESDGDHATDWVLDGRSRAGQASKSRNPQTKDDQSQTPAWLRTGPGRRMNVISQGGTTAQVDPLALCHFLLSACLTRGVQLHHPARALSLGRDLRGELASIRISTATASSETETDLPITHLILTSGAWTPIVFQQLFPLSPVSLPISSLAGHSLILRSPRWSSSPTATDSKCHAVFASSDAAGAQPLGFAPEIFSRLEGELYISGLNTTDLPLPERATDAKNLLDRQSIAQVRRVAAELLGTGGRRDKEGEVDDLQLVREGLCFRPVTRFNRPIITRLDEKVLGKGTDCSAEEWKTRGKGEGGVYVAAGQGPWGISMSLGTGLVVSQLVEGKGEGEMAAEIGGLGLE